ncbi:hypothetical protein BJ138DRAFT_1070818 [Hygrophoropsis aurantiaca]|uniref:Uncharacterized protein n=1 Tax=Hygrophoropsis aurantiaca TaxID=72124 RepID=A0ACB8A114_9AGAM|nr:hypothetical protein BJ138DRAFT_1070818 [Hygrophoropsis aurantiaca]
MSKTSQSEQSSPAFGASPSSAPTWGSPRNPLPPHRLAKLANALGVSTPLPATGTFGSFLSPSATFPASASSLHPPDHPWRSPTPSSASTHNIGSYTASSQPQSKFLLHVIPPLHLPHDSDASDSSELTPPPSNASGYHSQFRRGTLVALQSSLQAQLGVIAKEYALPSTIGLILYLVTAPSQSRQASPMPFQSSGGGDDMIDEPGPRLSEDIWKHIWLRVLKAEREETASHSLHPRSATPNNFGLGLHVDRNGHRPLVTRTETPQPQILGYPITPSPSTTASSMSDLRSHSKSAPPSSSSLTHSEPDTPDTSRSSDHDAPGLDLPGLDSPSIIPILAKVEFDIDRRKAGWYEPWVRSRRMNHAKRAESRSSNRTRSNSRAEGESVSEGKRPRFDLKLVERMQAASSTPNFLSKPDGSGDDESLRSGEYAPLSESPEVMGEESFEEEPTARITVPPGDQDPLADVFGDDADTWADMHAESQGKRRKVNSNVVELALDASSLTAPLEQEQSRDQYNDADEVSELMELMSRPSLTVSIPTPPSSKRRSSPTTAGPNKKAPPPPLVLAPHLSNHDLVVPAEPSPMPSSGSGGDSTNLPYIKGGGTPMSADMPHGETLSPEVEEEYLRARSPAEEKRVGGVFDDLDLGLDLGEDDEEYDENDPNDRRKSQYLMKAKLDEIERTLAQFSPRRLQTTPLGDHDPLHHARSPSSASQYTNASGPHPMSHASNSPGRSLRENRDTIRYDGTSTSSPESTNKSWPAVPFSSLSTKGPTNSPSPSRPTNLPPSPPRLAVNGVSTGAPMVFMSASRSSSSDAVSSETEIRKRELEQSMYPPLLPPSFTRKIDPVSSSPIPLSPDPFGRYPSGPDTDPNPSHSYWDPATGQFSSDPADSRPSLSSIDEGSLTSATPSSRFSADSLSFSVDDAAAKSAKITAPLVSVKSFKKLWRRSKSSSVSGQQPPTPVATRTSFQLSGPSAPPMSQDQLGIPASQKALPPPPIPTAALSKSGNAKTSMEQLHFDQESPYPIRRATPRPSQSNGSSMRPLSPPVPVTSEKTSVRKSILKSWKSVAGGTSQSSTSSISSEPRRSVDRPISTETVKPRRPSVLDDLNAIPPSPRLPEHFLASNGHSRTGSGALFEKRKSAGKSKMGQSSISSSSSQDMSAPWTQPRRSLAMALPHSDSNSPPRSMLSASSRESQDGRGSFDTSQFEMVSPPRMHPSLSYPYQTLDHE